MLKKHFVLCLVSSHLLLTGCGSDSTNLTQTDGIIPIQEPTEVGLHICANCHTGQIKQWMQGRHANSEGNSLDSTGTPDLIMLSGNSVCKTCHDPNEDSRNLTPELTGNTPRPVIGCEACHGGGSLHFGLGPIPVPSPDGLTTCIKCHNTADRPTSVQEHQLSENNLTAKFLTSRHANSTKTPQMPCQRCHTHEGALASNSAGYTGVKTDLMNSETDTPPGKLNKAPTEISALDQSPIQCTTCHDPHIAGELRTTAGWDPNQNDTNRDQFDLCTSCHNLLTIDGSLIASGSNGNGLGPVGIEGSPIGGGAALSLSDTSSFFHDDTWYRILATTHYDDPLTGHGSVEQVLEVPPADEIDAEATFIEGYTIRLNGENPCFDCHGHEFLTNTEPSLPPKAPTIYTQWASSPHGGRLFQAKLAAAAALDPDIDGDGILQAANAPVGTVTVNEVRAASTTSASAQRNWDRTGRASCQRCHTSTGAMNFLNANADFGIYNAADNDFSHLQGWATDPASGSPQNEMIFCWACHSNSSDGVLRNPGAITTQAGAALPNIGNSNVCVSCHSNRERNGAPNIHHAQSGGFVLNEFVNPTLTPPLFGEFPGLVYTNNDVFRHDNLGMFGPNLTAGAGDPGPCVSCHMEGAEFANHTFEMVERSSTDRNIIVSVRTQNVCGECHTPGFFEITKEELQLRFNGYSQTIDYLKTIIGQGLPVDVLTQILDENGNPVINNDVTPPAPFTISNNTQAVNNSELIDNDHRSPYVHNSTYIRRLLFDSIDWVDNGAFNGTIQLTDIDINGDGLPDDLSDARLWLGGDAVNASIARDSLQDIDILQ